ncbi:MAG: peptidylprolyl isomerase [Coriobacteriales bacterium]|jgi:FKBP-type peptidyl-prolyl cis-trans isomerase 2|nr:peptidylprolyl isomerase [Coriobacteriales bacterium]
MSNAGKRVKTHYIGTLDDGTQFDSSVERGEPIEFVCMAGQMIPGFDAAVETMLVGETKSVHIPAAQAYGEKDAGLLHRIPIGQIPGLETVPVGETVYLRGPDAQPMPVVIVEVGDDSILIDLNHHLAGQNLNFEITLVEIVE